MTILLIALVVYLVGAYITFRLMLTSIKNHEIDPENAAAAGMLAVIIWPLLFAFFLACQVVGIIKIVGNKIDAIISRIL